MTSLVVAQTCFGEIDVELDAAEDFIADDVFIAQVDNGVALLQECGEREALVFSGEAAQRAAGFGGGGAFHLADVVFVFHAETLEGICFSGIFFIDLIEAGEGLLVGFQTCFAFFSGG